MNQICILSCTRN